MGYEAWNGEVMELLNRGIVESWNGGIVELFNR